jgi:hypothetical protein
MVGDEVGAAVGACPTTELGQTRLKALVKLATGTHLRGVGGGVVRGGGRGRASHHRGAGRGRRRRVPGRRLWKARMGRVIKR